MAKNNYDTNTIKLEKIEYKNHFGRLTPMLFNTLLDLNSREQKVLQKLLNMLNSDIDYRAIIGYANYRFMINCTITELSKLLNINRSVLSKALKELEKHNLIKHDKENERLIYINPFLFNTHRLFDIRTLNAFRSEWEWKDKIKNDKRPWDDSNVKRRIITEEERKRAEQNGSF